ncbi:E3 ubiquitin-protein ligase RMA1H1-like [Rutidosis leptorrhynchoides]|uniref:E3 ubiquitin-protein ligase RMA1H1-like n=1 Tax=Rutidosis leptorrhynchoides TaxID=125765 RepID=UPI003A99225B
MDHYLQDLVPQNIYKEDISQKKYKSSNESFDESENGSSSGFDCNICLDTVHDPVVTLCGHLYCWPCIYKWFTHQKTTPEYLDIKNAQCPVCKSEISQKSIIPLYSRGQTIETISKEQALNPGLMIPRRPLSPRSSVQNVPAQQPIHRTHQQVSMPISMINPTSPTTGMLGEIVYEIFGNSQTSLFAYPNSYNLAGITTQRSRFQAMQADQSLSRVCFFLLCCVMLCLVLF